MGIAITLQEYLDREGVPYEVTEHPHTHNSRETAQAAHVPGDYLAKSVLLEDEQGYVLAVIPSTHRVELGKLRKALNRNLGLATEDEVGRLFRDCEIGAIPPVGQAYGVDVVVDDGVAERAEIYFEAGDHLALIHMDGQSFERLMGGVPHGHFSRHG